jgi:hypothetical protein
LHVNPHAPELHVAVELGGATHSLQVVPQWVGSVFRSKHVVVLPHFPHPLWHENPQTPLPQVGVACGGAVQALPQVPQLAGSLGRLTHCPEQFVVPPVQSSVQTPFEQT